MAILSNSGLRTWTNSGHFLYRKKKLFWWLQNHQTMLTPGWIMLWFTSFSLGWIYYQQCGQILRCKHFKNIHDGPEEGGIFNLSLFHTKKNELEFSPTKSINQTNNFFTSICGMWLPRSSEPSPLGSHNERKVGNNFLKRGESEWNKNISDT